MADAAVLAEGRSSLADQLRLRPARSDTTPVFAHGSLAPNLPVRLEQGASVARITTSRPQTFRSGAPLRVTVGAGLHVDLDSLLVAAPPAQRRPLPAQLDPVAYAVLDENGTRRGDLIIFEAAVERHRDSTRIQRLDGVLILR